MSLLNDLDDGQKRAITAEDFDQFLDFLPPVLMNFRWQNERWDYGFAEGDDFVYAFKKQGEQYFAQKTEIRNPLEAPLHPIEVENKTPPGLIFRWLEIGKQNPWISTADDPPFNTQSFQHCPTDRELLDRFAHGNWSLGQAFHIGNLCFINQVDGGDEWLAIKDTTAFESISFGNIIEKQGRAAAQDILDRIRRTEIEKCVALDY